MLKHLVIVSLAVVAGTGVAQAVGGSYENSCDNIRQRGPYITADCETRDGDYRRTSIDARRCGGDIKNSNGRLTCSRGRGGYYGDGGGYDRGGQGYGDDGGEPRRRYFRVPDQY